MQLDMFPPAIRLHTTHHVHYWAINWDAIHGSDFEHGAQMDAPSAIPTGSHEALCDDEYLPRGERLVSALISRPGEV